MMLSYFFFFILFKSILWLLLAVDVFMLALPSSFLYTAHRYGFLMITYHIYLNSVKSKRILKAYCS